MREDFYKKVIKNSPIGYAYHKIICDSNGKPCDYEYLEVNNAFEKHTGLRAEEIIGKKISEILPKILESEFNWIGVYGNIALNGGEEEYEQYSEALGKWYRVHVYSPEKYYFITNFIDITKDMRNIEEKQTIINAVNEVIFELDMDYVFKNVISWDHKILFLPIEEIINKRIYDVLSQEMADLFINALNMAFSSMEKQSITYKFPIEGKVKWFEAKIKYIEIHNKGRYIVSVSDITEQKLLAERLELSKRMLWKVMDTIPSRIFWKDRELRYLGCNEKFAKDAGFSSPKEIVGMDDYQMSWREFADIYRKEEKEIIETGNSILNFDQCVLTSNGKAKWFKISKIPLYDSDNNIYGMMGIYEDVTEQKRAEELLKESQIRYEQLADLSRSIVWEVDKTGLYTYISPVSEKAFGYKPDEIMGKMYFYDLVLDEDKEETIEFGYSMLKQKCAFSDYEHRIKHKNNKIIWLLCSGFPVLDVHGDILAFRGIDIDITYLKEVEDKIKYLSFHDQLTGLYNRRFFEEELKRLDTERNLPLSLAMIDVNGLKLINDAFGHKAGDEMLKKVAETVKKECRADDIIARIGGDEFVILLPKTDYSDAIMILDRIHEAVGKEKIEAINLSISYGCETKKKKSESMEDVVKVAETHMYRFKTSERTNLRRETIKVIIKRLFEEIPLEESHSNRVSEISVLIGKELGLNELDLNKLKMSGLLHDIGKIAINKEIILEKEPLNDDDWTEVKRHPEVSYTILSSSNEYSIFAEDVLYHHERYDGKGYPKGLKGEEIPLNSRIISIADAYDSMTSDRPYKQAMNEKQAIKILQEEAGKQFDPQIVKIIVDKVLNKGT